MKLKGISFVDFVDLMDKYGYGSIESLTTLEPDPLKWNKNQWHFAIELIAKSANKSLETVKQNLSKPSEILFAFNEALRKTGLVIQLTQISKLSDKAFAKHLEKSSPKWDVEYRNE